MSDHIKSYITTFQFLEAFDTKMLVIVFLLIVASAYFSSYFLSLMETMIKTDQDERKLLMTELLESTAQSNLLTLQLAKQIEAMADQQIEIERLYNTIDNATSPVALPSDDDDGKPSDLNNLTTG